MSEEQLEVTLLLSIVFYSVVLFLLCLVKQNKMSSMIWSLLFTKAILHIILFFESFLYINQSLGEIVNKFGFAVFTHLFPTTEQSEITFIFLCLGKTMVEQSIPLILFIEVCFSYEVYRKIGKGDEEKMFRINYIMIGGIVIFLNLFVIDAFLVICVIMLFNNWIMGILTMIQILREKEFNLNGNKFTFALIFLSQFLMFTLFFIFWIFYYISPTVDFISEWFSCFSIVFNCLCFVIQFFMLNKFSFENETKKETAHKETMLERKSTLKRRFSDTDIKAVTIYPGKFRQPRYPSEERSSSNRNHRTKFKQRDFLKERYIEEHQRLCNKKDKLWATMDVSKWEIVDEFDKIDRLLLFRDKTYATAKMCTRDTQFVENLHKQLDYANCMNNEELKRLIDNNGKQFIDNFKQFADLLYPTLNDSLAVWSQLASYADAQSK